MPSPERKPDPANEKKDLIVEFRDRYGELMVDAQEAADTTETEGWAKLYASTVDHDRKHRQARAKRITELADMLERNGLDEEGIKELKDEMKSVVEQAAMFEAFMNNTVGKLKAPVENCRVCKDEFRQRAETLESKTPLVNTGLAELMRMEIAKVHVVTWDQKHGRVIITNGNPGNGGLLSA